MKHTHHARRVLSLLLAVTMMVTCWSPLAAYAAEAAPEQTAGSSETGSLPETPAENEDVSDSTQEDGTEPVLDTPDGTDVTVPADGEADVSDENTDKTPAEDPKDTADEPSDPQAPADGTLQPSDGEQADTPPEGDAPAADGTDAQPVDGKAVETHIATYVNTLPAGVEWPEDVTAATFGTAYSTVKAAAKDGTEYTVEVVPQNIVYFIDPINYNEGTVSKPFNAVKALVGDKLLNNAYDQMKTDGNAWGLIPKTTVSGKSSDATQLLDKDYTAVGGANTAGDALTWVLPLPAGKYTVTSLHQEYWNSRNMTAVVSVDGVNGAAQTIAVSGAGDKKTSTQTFNVRCEEGETAEVRYIVSPTGDNAAYISWLGVVREGDADPLPSVERPTQTLPANYDKSLEDNDGLELTQGAVLEEVTGFGKVLKLSSDWNNQNQHHANIKDTTAFKSGSFTVLMDVNVATDANAKASVLSIGADADHGDRCLRLLQRNGTKLGYGQNYAQDGGFATNEADLTGFLPGTWNALALTYTEAGGGNGSVTVYLNGQKAGEVADLGFKLSELETVSAMVGRTFNSSFMPTGQYDNIVVFNSVVDDATLCAETAWRKQQKDTPPLNVVSLEEAIEAAQVFVDAGVSSTELTTALAEAKAVLQKAQAGDKTVKQSHVNAACEKLNVAMNNVGKVTINGDDVAAAAGNVNGLTYKGFGMLNGNATSNLLLDYKAENPDAYWAMMEYLFGGEHPLFTSIKMEMGNDGNNSTGAEACTMRYADEEADVSRSPGFVMAADAKKINPNVKISFLRWGYPNWVGEAGFRQNVENEAGWEAMYKWYRETIFDAYEKYGYVVDFVNPDTNETGNPDDAFIKWYKNRVANETEFPAYMDAAAQAAYKNIRIIASDENKGLQIVPHMRADADLYNAVDIIGFHYRTNATDDYIRMADVDDKEVWYSEGCATFAYSELHENKTGSNNSEYGAYSIGGFQSPLALSDSFISAFQWSRRTHYMFQPAIGSFYEGIQYGHKELLSARDPWSGYIHYDPVLYMLSHFAKFAKTGWENADNTAGIWRAIPQATNDSFGGSSNEHQTAGIDGRAGYMTLAAPDKSDFSVVFVNNTRNAKTFVIEAEKMGVEPTAKLNIWTTQTDSYLQKTGEVTGTNGVWVVTLPAYSVVTATTLGDTPERAPVDGIHNDDRTVLDTDATGRVQNTTDKILYADNFEYKEEPAMKQYDVRTGTEKDVPYLTARGNEPRYMLDAHGAWVVENGRLKHELAAGVSQWNGGDPSTIVGDFRWMDYTASIDVIFPQSTLDAVENHRGVLGSLTIRAQTGMNWNNSGYTLRICADGRWDLWRKGSWVLYGDIPVAEDGVYHLSLTGLGDTVTAVINGEIVGTYQDANPMLSGRVKVNSSWNQLYFDNLLVETVPGGIPYALSMMDGQDDGVRYAGSWDIGSSAPAGGSADDWYRTLSKNKEAGASFTFDFFGDGFALTGPGGNGVTLKVVVDGKTIEESVACKAPGNRNELYTVSGFGMLRKHTATVTVVEGTISLDAIHTLGTRLEAPKDAIVDVESVVLDSALTGEQLLNSLPDELTVTTAGGEEKKLPVTWNFPTNKELDAAAFQSFTVTGEIEGVKNAAGFPIMVSGSVDVLVPEGGVYYIDTVTPFNKTDPAEIPTTTVPYEAVKKALGDKLLNQVYDQPWADDGSTTWGLTVYPKAGNRDANDINNAMDSGIYVEPNAPDIPLTYYFTLPAGEYTLRSGHREWWSQNRPMKATLTIGDETIDAGEIKLSGSNNDLVNLTTFTLTEETLVAYTVTSTGNQAPVISWLAVVDNGVKPDRPAADAAEVLVRIDNYLGQNLTQENIAEGEALLKELKDVDTSALPSALKKQIEEQISELEQKLKDLAGKPDDPTPPDVPTPPVTDNTNKPSAGQPGSTSATSPKTGIAAPNLVGTPVAPKDGHTPQAPAADPEAPAGLPAAPAAPQADTSGGMTLPIVIASIAVFAVLACAAVLLLKKRGHNR